MLIHVFILIHTSVQYCTDCPFLLITATPIVRGVKDTELDGSILLQDHCYKLFHLVHYTELSKIVCKT